MNKIKEYKVSIAIIISSIIISFTIWYTQTYKDRARHNNCIQSAYLNVTEELTQRMKDDIRMLCHYETYIER